MFMGQYLHNLDEKGRIIIPTKIREQLTASVVVTIGFDKCITLYSMEGWEKFQTSLLALPSNLLAHAGAIKECVIVGVLDHVEIWSKEVWEAYQSDAMSTMEEVAEKLSKQGA